MAVPLIAGGSPWGSPCSAWQNTLSLGACQDRYPALDTELSPGSVLALYTDGLIEQPGQDIGTGMSRHARTLTASPA